MRWALKDIAGLIGGGFGMALGQAGNGLHKGINLGGSSAGVALSGLKYFLQIVTGKGNPFVRCEAVEEVVLRDCALA